MTTTSKTIWTRAGKEVREPLLIGRKISREWLGGRVPMLKIAVVGPLRQALLDMLSVAKDGKLNLPIVSLRTSLLLLPRQRGARGSRPWLVAAAQRRHPFCCRDVCAGG